MGLVCSKAPAVLSPRTHPEAGPEASAHPLGGGAMLTHGFSSKRRGSVSSSPTAHGLEEGVGASAATSPTPRRVVVPKSDEARLRLRALIQHTLLFKDLDEEQQSCIVDAMCERRVASGEVIIREGEEGDNFYAIESGAYTASVGGQEKFRYEGHGSFGELALMYNCPRAATITAQSEGVLWALDRGTFRSLVVGSMVAARARREDVLTHMRIFAHLSGEQLAAIADCLATEVYQPGEHVLREAEALSSDAKFYIVEQGSVQCYRTFEGRKVATKALGPGDTFGEVGLLTKAPRQADCVAATQVRLLTMGRDAFERLMGPVEDILARQIAEYNQLNAGGQGSFTGLPPGLPPSAAPGPNAHAPATAAATSGQVEPTRVPRAAAKGGDGGTSTATSTASVPTAAQGRMLPAHSGSRRGSSQRAGGSAAGSEAGECDSHPVSATPSVSAIEVEEAKRIEDLAPPADGEGGSASEGACSLEPIAEEASESRLVAGGPATA